VGAEEGRNCKGATCQRQEERPEKKGCQKGGEDWARLLYRLWRNLPVKGKRWGRIAIFHSSPPS
jgi:hypothetical protein